MNYHAYFPSVKLIDSMRSTSKKEMAKKAEEKRSAKSNNAVSRLVQDRDTRNNSKPKEVTTGHFYTKIKKETNDMTHSKNFQLQNKNIFVVDLSKNGNSPINHSKQNLQYNITKSTNFSDFKNNVMKNPSKNGNISESTNNLLVKNSVNKSHGETSFNVSQVNFIKSSNVSFDRNNEKSNNNPNGNSENTSLGYSNSRSTNNLLKANIEVNSPEELHFFYVNIMNQNKGLAYKFEGENYQPENFEECDF